MHFEYNRNTIIMENLSKFTDSYLKQELKKLKTQKIALGVSGILLGSVVGFVTSKKAASKKDKILRSSFFGIGAGVVSILISISIYNEKIEKIELELYKRSQAIVK